MKNFIMSMGILDVERLEVTENMERVYVCLVRERMIDLIRTLGRKKEQSEMREVRYKGERHACRCEAGKIPANMG